VTGNETKLRCVVFQISPIVQCETTFCGGTTFGQGQAIPTMLRICFVPAPLHMALPSSAIRELR
jgi:hypothetical protein